ncbi:MAG: Kef-type transport system, putative NAD-binding component [Labilithrix sp.]|nr:Kef-type transport system, putative NAD-binding component [Labilithrix sp.]
MVVVGAATHPLRDAYHSVLRMRWASALTLIALLYLVANALFGVVYTAVGGISGAHDGSFRDGFFFSVQTMGTVGYGAMYPVSTTANLVVVAETVASVILTALATGIVFARFSQSSGRIVFTSKLCISPMNGVPTLMCRVGNDSAGTIFEATIRLAATRTETTDEGMTFYRLTDLVLTRDRTPALNRSWTVLHPIDEKSPLHGLAPEDWRKDDIEVLVSVVGTDDISLQPVNARRRYVANDILWGARPADVLADLPDGRLQLDVGRFDDVIGTAPTASFPYPKAG